jgi:hypothetical protein
MPDKSLYEKLLDNVPLVVILVGVVIFIIAASNGFTIGAANMQIQDLVWQIAVGILGSALVLIGLAIYISERLGYRKSSKVKTFKDVLSCLKYVNQKIQSANIQIDDLSLVGDIGKSDDLPSVEAEAIKYHSNVKQLTNNISYREVFILNRRNREEKIFGMLANNASGYSCAYYPEIPQIPSIQFMIIDKKEVIFLNGEYPYIAVQNPDIVDLFTKYYEDIWKKSVKLKYGNDFDWKMIEKALGNERTSALQKLLNPQHA